MTPEELQRIEVTLGLTLPKSFKRFMTNYPQALLNASVTIENDYESYTERPSELELVNAVDAIIRLIDFALWPGSSLAASVQNESPGMWRTKPLPLAV